MSDTAKPIMDHLRELRRRVFIVVLTLIFTTSICYLFVEDIYQFLVAPLADNLAGENRKLIYTSLTEAFFTYMKLSFFCGFAISTPVLAHQIYSFTKPGLYENEKGAVVPYLIASPVLFILGALLVYYFIFPLAWQFFLGFESNSGNLPILLEAKVSEYLSLVTSLIMGFGIAFQMPLIIVLLVRADIISVESLRKKRRHAIVFIFIISAILTPPDIISQIGLAIPLMLLYEAAIFASLRIKKNA